MTTTETTPRIYVGTYHKYNSGSIAGKWMDLTDYSDKDEFYKACKKLHKDEKDPEFMFQDYEGIPEAFISESHIADNFWEYLEAMDNVSDKEAFEIFVRNGGVDITDINSAIENFNESFCGAYKDLEDYAWEYVNDCVFDRDTPETLKTYFNYEAFARDLGYEGFWEESGYVFRPY